MRRFFTNLYRDESGSVVIMVGAALLVLLVFSVYAIDMPQMLFVRTQLQNAADAGCLAGALVGGLTSDTVLATNTAIIAAGHNQALIDSGGDNIMDDVVISDTDVTFDGNKICVVTHRTEGTGDQFLNYFLRVFSESGEVGEMTARACAEFAWVCGGDCLKPWSPPDKWCDSCGTGDCDNGNGLFEAACGEFYDPVTTGYNATSNLGDQITLVNGNGNDGDFGEFWYYSIDFPPLNDGNPISGGDEYQEWICNCEDEDPGCGCKTNQQGPYTVDPGDDLQVEPGRKTGPNRSGGECLIAQDPEAYWNDQTNTVEGSAYPISPRIVKVAFFDPSIGLGNGYNGRSFVRVVKVIVLFVESVTTPGNDVQITGRFMRLNEPGGEVCENQQDPTWLYKALLVE